MAKSFAWSFSRLKNYETCPKRHHEVDILKTFKDKGGEALEWGTQVHEGFAKSLSEGTPLPAELTAYQHWVDRVKDGPGDLYVEQKYAITKDFAKTSWFAPDAWYRGIGDVVRIDGPVGLVLDWKTGKITVDSVQLLLMAQCIFSHFPTVQKVRSEFVWLKDDCSTPEVYTKQDVADGWYGVLARLEDLERAHLLQSYPPKPGFLCKRYCPVTICAFHGK